MSVNFATVKACLADLKADYNEARQDLFDEIEVLRAEQSMMQDTADRLRISNEELKKQSLDRCT